MKIEITGVKELRAELKEFSDRRFKSAVATALTRTASAVGKDWKQQLTGKFDRPTPATTGAVVIKRAENTAENMVAEVKLRDQAGAGGKVAPVEWLAVHELGGARRVKKFEAALQAQGSMPRGWKATPGPAARLDAYGNVSRAQIVQVLAQLGSKFSPGYARVISASASKRAARAIQTGRAYVAIQPNNKAGLTPGIYERSGRQLRAVFFYVQDANYRKRLDLVEGGKRQVGQLLGAELRRAISESAARLAAKGNA